MKTLRTKRKLTTVEAEECARLKSAWLSWQDANRDERGKKIPQEAFAQEHLKTGQANFSHYLNGQQPLNLEALLVISKALECRPDAISPRLMALITDAGFSQVPDAPIEHLLEEMPLPNRQETLSFVEYQLTKSGIFENQEKFSHYMQTLDRLLNAKKTPPKNN